jgi:cyclopropane fatty-acyl-phospholipid synthase-like methyltransferase
MTDAFTYQGDELELFQHAKNWKQYFAKQIKPHIKGKVLEVGAGIGATTLLLNDEQVPEWVLLEPDESMAKLLSIKIIANELPSNCELKSGTINSLNSSFDTIIYIDVIEHIAADSDELKKAVALLNDGGKIIILSPAFQFLFSPFDKAIGHYRRYNKKMLQQITPDELTMKSSRYYDTIGFFASVVNKLFLRQKYPTMKQVLFWDRWMVPVSKVTDKLCFHTFGKSIIGIWEKKQAGK